MSRPSLLRALAAAAVAVCGIGVVGWTPLGLPVRDPILDGLEARAESLDRVHVGPHVSDRERLLGPFAEKIEWLAASIWRDLRIDVQTVTVHAPGEDMPDLVSRLFRERLSSRRASTGAVLIVLETGQRRARLETSYDLEGAIPDVVAKRLARDQLAPYVSYAAAGMAVMDVLHFLKDYALDQAVRGNLPLPEDLEAGASYRERLAEISGGGGARIALPDLPADLELRRTIPAELRPRYAPSADPLETVDSFARVMRDFAGDPTLELFTPGSRIMRELYPVAPYEEALRQRRLEDSRPLRVVERGDRAVAFSDTAVQGFVPVLLRRDGGLWRVDLVETWKNLFFDSNGEYYVHNTNNPYAFGLRHLAQGRRYDVAPVELPEGETIAAAISRLESQSTARAHLELAELYFRNCFAWPAAFEHYEQAVRLAPGDREIARTYGRRTLYLGLTSLAIPHLKRAGPEAWEDVARAYARAGNLAKAERYYRRALRRNPDSRSAQRGLAWTLERRREN